MANNIHDQDDDGTIDGTAQSDVIYGGTSNGNANGGAVVNDTIDGGQSDDTIYAGDGDDLIFGGDAGDAAGGGSGAKVVEEFQFDLDNADPVDEGNGDGNIGDSILYRNVATADDGTPISVRITIVNQSDDDLDIELGRSDNYPIFLEGGEPGTKVDVRVDFLDSAGNPVTINSNFTFRDVDYYGNDNKEGVTFDTTDITHYAVSGSPSSSVQVDDRGDEIEFTTDTGGDTGDENLWTQVFFENQSSLNFTLESRDNDAGYGFDTANFSNTPIITEVDASGDDLLYGGDGNDSALGGGGDDTIYGEAGEDTLDGGKGADTLFGGDGNDSVLGDAGDDTLYGNAGNDTLDGGEGTDTLFGGDGQDRFIGSDGADSISGGTGQDTVDYSASGSGVTVDLSAGTATGGDAAGDQLTGVDGVIGSDHADTIIGFDGESTGPDGFTNVFYGGTGNDSLDGRGGSDSLFGGDGSDNIEGGSGNDSIDGGDDADTIAGGIGDDSIDGGTGADSIDAGSGNDTVLGGTGADVITGGAGNDSIDGGNSGDSIDAGTGHDVVTAGSGSDTVYAGDGNDSIDGGADDDTISAGSGDDVVEGGSGSDSIDAGTGNDTILAGADQDLVYAGVGDDSIDGGSGSDTLFAGIGADTIDGGSGTDTIYAGDGNDTIDGGEGGDTLYGGDGDDKIVMDESSGIDNVFGGDGLDHLDLSGSSSGVTVDLSSAGATVTAGSGQATFDGIEEVTLTSGADTVINNGYTDDINIDLGTGNDVLQSGAGDDTISGGAGNDTIVAGTGDDIVIGGAGNDSIDGGAGNDSIDGGAGADTLSGGAGNDTLTGGTGNDVFELSASGGDDTITDFSAGSDTFDTTALTDVGNALTNQDGIVTAEEVVVTQPGGPGTDQLLSFPSGETVSVPDGTVNTFSTATQFASLVAMGVPPCFAPGTLIATSRGEVRVEDLRVGDMIMTARNGPQPLRWIGVRTEVFANRDAGNKPILIRAGALGDGFPTRDLVVSPQHRMLMTGNPVKNMFDESQVFATAKNLTALPGVRCMLGKSEITYYALLLDRHEIIFAEGTATESFRPGPVVMRGFEAQIREEIYAIYPKLRAAPVKGLGEPAARLLNGRESRAIARRIAKRLSRRDDDISAGKRSSDDGQASEKEQISAP
ncbi:MAG: Hint domain-containing protein [Pseudomonadota bacterium]